MLDPRVLRTALLPAVVAVVVLMFSLEPAPEPIEPPISVPEMSVRETARTARTILDLAPERTPGSAGDRAVAGLVRERFGAIDGGQVATQSLSSSFEGTSVELENVLLTLPGERQEVLLVIAGRDSAEGAGATTSAASTATLLSLAQALGGSSHAQTIVLASTSGASDGGKGARELIAALPAPEGISSAVVLEGSGVEELRRPLVFAPRTDPDSPAVQLLATAEEIASVRYERDAADTNGWVELARLAFPTGLGEGAVAAAAGVESITISPAGERVPEQPGDTAEAISNETLSRTGAVALTAILTLDEAESEPREGPADYLRVGDSLLPGWALGLLGLTLILPPLLAAGDVWLRDRRRSPRIARRSIPWALERLLVPLLPLLLLYLLGLIGLVPSPSFPYDPGRFPPGTAAVVAAVALLGMLVLAVLLTRPLRTPLDSEPQTLGAAAGIITVLALLGLWALNPYLALLLVPAGYVWLLPCRSAAPPRRPIIAAVALLTLVPAGIAAGLSAGAIDLGLEAPWHALIFVVSGGTGLLTALLWCGVLGGLLGCVAAARARSPSAPEPKRVTMRGPSGYAGPGSLGGTTSGRRGG
jgi:hypothetical protein